MHVAVDLHTHAAHDRDSRTPAQRMARFMAEEFEFAMLGIVGHDFRPTADPSGVLSTTGIEHEVRRNPRVHVIEFPDHDVSILAHPKLSHMNREDVWEFIHENNIDAVEKFTGGRKQFEGTIPVPAVGASDSHSPLLLGTSFVVVDVDEVSVDGVFHAIRAGDFKTVVRPPSLPTRLLARAEKSLTRAIKREPKERQEQVPQGFKAEQRE